MFTPIKRSLAVTLALVTSLAPLEGHAGALRDKMSVGTDHTRFETAEFTRDQIEVTIVEYDTHRELLAAANEKGVSIDHDIRAWAEVELETNRCTIHTLNIAKNYKRVIEWLGHELAHCRHGRFH